MLFILTNTSTYYAYTLDKKYIDKLQNTKFNITLFAQKVNFLDRKGIYTIEIENINDVLELKEIVGHELIFANIYRFDEIKIPQIEIYDDYRE